MKMETFNLYNLNGENLEWLAHVCSMEKLADKVRHVRVEDKALWVAVQENGVVHVMNRKGSILRWFPNGS